ncbi:ATP-binding protein [Halomarina rubra]|uniref:ATP-binding protein n=1 Tax=Halomarina rubra TaxID=2071873 RepID=A0ABD6AQC2_9EURY|nr:DUF87 domain-containing protein [Halomarina rubra]
MHVLGSTDDLGPVGHLGAYRARDGSPGEEVGLDLGGPHAALVVGKRGFGKSYTLGVLAEELARTDGVAPVVVDPMGTFVTLADSPESVPARVVEPRVRADALDPQAWCSLLGLDATSAVGALVWRAACETTTLDEMVSFVGDGDAPDAVRMAAENHLRLAESWGVFDAGSPDLSGSEATILDCSGLDDAAMNAVCLGVAEACYRGRLDGSTARQPWLLVDEAHVFFEGVAASALARVLTRGRAPGVSLVCATQRPGALPPVAVSQSDLVVMHRLTGRADLRAFRETRPTYVGDDVETRMPERPGDALVVDDATEGVHAIRIRERLTPHGGDSPRVATPDDTPDGDDDCGDEGDGEVSSGGVRGGPTEGSDESKG